MNDLRLNIYKSLSSYESRLVGIEEILWWLRSDESLRNKTELYRHLARTVSREEANKKVKEVLVPAFSVVGMLFAREDSPRTIVESPLVGIAQHDLTSWQVLPDSMQEVEDFEPECKVYNETFRQWTTDVEPDSLRIMTNEVFDALAAGGARTFDEISASPESLQRVLKALGTFDEGDARWLEASIFCWRGRNALIFIRSTAMSSGTFTRAAA